MTSKKPIRLKTKMLENCGHGLLHVETYGYDILVTHLNPENTDKRRDEAKNIVRYIEEKSLDKCLLMGDMNAHSPADADYMETNSYRLLTEGRQNPNLLDGNFDYSVISCFLSLPLIDVCRSFVAPDKRTTFPSPILMNLSRHKEIRKQEGKWKLHIKTFSQTGVDYFKGKLPLLFDLEQDPSEKYDLSEQNSELVARLQQLLEAKDKEIRETGSFFRKGQRR